MFLAVFINQTLSQNLTEIDNQNSDVGVVYEEEIAVEKKEKLHGEGIEPSDECLAPGMPTNIAGPISDVERNSMHCTTV